MNKASQDHHHRSSQITGGLSSSEHTYSSSLWAYGLFTAIVGIFLLLYILGIFTSIFGLDTALLLTLVAGFPLLQDAISDLLAGRLSTYLIIAIAAGAALAVGEYFAAAEVMFIMLVGEGLERFTVERAHRAITGFFQIKPTIARVRRNGEEAEVLPEEVQVGDLVLVRAGEKVPVDGVVIKGQSTVDQKMITGEPMPVQKAVGDHILSGCVNEYGVLEISAERVGEDTTVARIVQFISEAQKRRAPIVRTADRLAQYFLPAVLLAGGAVYLLTGEILRSVSALIVACPCALVLATPTAMAASLGRLAREGVLVKGGGIIEALARIRCVAFDKTGTLTMGRPQVHDIVPSRDVDKAEVLALAASAEKFSEHILGREIVREAERQEIHFADPEDFVVRPGLGVVARVQGREVRVGNLALAREVVTHPLSWAERILSDHAREGHTSTLIMVDARVLGVVSFRDPVRTEAADAVARLQEVGIPRILMLTGDEEITAQVVGRQIGLTEIYSRLLPEEKVRKIRGILSEGQKTLMVGDGVNDAPSLATADVGLAMGRGAAEISAEAAHVVFMRDRLDHIPDLITFARRIIKRIKSSILIFAFALNFGAVLVAALGYIGPAVAAIIHQGSSLAVILNCLRLLVEGKAVQDRPLERIWFSWNERLHRLRQKMGSALGGLVHEKGRNILLWTAWFLILLWLLSGLVIIGPDQVGVVQRFARLVEGELGPGVHYCWPWPVERVTRVAPHKVRTLEIGFRRSIGGGSEPRVYEWNTRHMSDRFRQVIEESLMLSGDENLVEVYGVVHYDISDPALFLFQTRDPEKLMRLTAERTLRWTIARFSLDEILTTALSTLEEAWKQDLSQAHEDYGSGLRIQSVLLKHVHPPLEVVPAFREVATALEDRSTLINEAEGYLKEQVPIAHGMARARLIEAAGYSESRIRRSQGEGARFTAQAEAFQDAAETTADRLYLETIEGILAGKPKYITKGPHMTGRRRFLFFDSEALRWLNLGEQERGSP